MPTKTMSAKANTARTKPGKTKPARKGAGKPAPRIAPVGAAPVDLTAPGMALLRVDQIARSPLNPRRSFDAASIAELAASIAERGLLQNLVVREHGRLADTTFELIAGERRHRALQLLIDDGRWPVDRAVPCRIVDAFDDAEARAIALLENLQREDVAPLEEAAAFKALIGLGWSTAAIAAKIHRTQRHVQLRVALVENLIEPARKALAAGDLTLAEARVLASVPEDKQKSGLKALKDRFNPPRTAEDLRRRITGECIALDKALLAPPDNCPGVIEVLDDNLEPHRVFENRAAFIAWQEVCVEKETARLAGVWAFAECCREWEADERFQSTGDHRDRQWITTANHKQGGAVIIFDGYRGDATIVEGVLRQAETEEDDSADDAARDAALATRGQRSAALTRFENALRSKVADGQAMIAHRLFVFWTLTDAEWRAPQFTFDSYGLQIDRAAIVSIAPSLATVITTGEDEDVPTWTDPLAAWEAVARLGRDKPVALYALAGALIGHALCLPILPWKEGEPDVDVVTEALARELRVPIDPCLTRPPKAQDEAA